MGKFQRFCRWVDRWWVQIACICAALLLVFMGAFTTIMIDKVEKRDAIIDAQNELLLKASTCPPPPDCRKQCKEMLRKKLKGKGKKILRDLI